MSSSHLALLGGKPTKTKPFPAWPQHDQRERQALLGVLDSSVWWRTPGERTLQFERDFAAYHDARHGIAVTNGTHALEVALLALGSRPRRRGDRARLYVRRHCQRGADDRSTAGVRRRARRHVLSRRRSGRGRDHAAHQGDHRGSHGRAPGGPGSPGRHRGNPRLKPGRGQRPRPRHAMARSEGRRDRPRGHFQLPAEQADDGRRRRHDRHQRRRSGAAPALGARLRPHARRVVLQPFHLRFELSAERMARGDSVRAA